MNTNLEMHLCYNFFNLLKIFLSFFKPLRENENFGKLLLSQFLAQSFEFS